MRKWLAILGMALLPLFAAAQVNTLPSAPHLIVKGHAETRVMPDRFTIQLNVDVTNLSPAIAREQVEVHMRQLLQALQKDGAMPHQTHASTLSIQPASDYENGKSVFKGTDVSRSINATFDSLDKLRAFIAAVPADKAVQIGSVQTSRSDIAAVSLRLRHAAIENSKQAAEKIAAAYGVKIIGIYAVSEVAPDFAYGIQAGSWSGPAGVAEESVMSTPAAPAAPPPPADVAPALSPSLRVGTQTVAENIYAVYLIGPG